METPLKNVTAAEFRGCPWVFDSEGQQFKEEIHSKVFLGIAGGWLLCFVEKNRSLRVRALLCFGEWYVLVKEYDM